MEEVDDYSETFSKAPTMTFLLPPSLEALKLI